MMMMVDSEVYVDFCLKIILNSLLKTDLELRCVWYMRYEMLLAQVCERAAALLVQPVFQEAKVTILKCCILSTTKII